MTPEQTLQYVLSKAPPIVSDADKHTLAADTQYITRFIKEGWSVPDMIQWLTYGEERGFPGTEEEALKGMHELQQKYKKTASTIATALRKLAGQKQASLAGHPEIMRDLTTGLKALKAAQDIDLWSNDQVHELHDLEVKLKRMIGQMQHWNRL